MDTWRPPSENQEKLFYKIIITVVLFYKVMETPVSIVDYIKTKYPKLIFSPVKFNERNAVGFILTGSQMIIGYINSTGNLCKLAEPINLAELTEEYLGEVVSKIPLVDGFTEKDKENLIKILNKRGDSISTEEHNRLIDELKRRIESEKDAQYKVLVDSTTNETALIKSQYEGKLDDIRRKYNELTEQIDTCKRKLIEEKGLVIKGIEEYKEKIGQMVKEKDYKIEELQKMYKGMVEERDTLKNKMDELYKSEEERARRMSDDVSEYKVKLTEREKEIEQLREAIEEINGKLSSSEMKAVLLESVKDKCRDQILNEKDIIISKINEYNSKWEEWSKGVMGNVEAQKAKLLSELRYIESGIKEIVQNANVEKSEFIKLKQNAEDIVSELNKTIADQLAQLNYYKEKNEILSSSSSSSITTCEGENEKIAQLSKELDDVRKLLAANNATKIENVIDYDNCHQTLMNFYALNNIFYRKLEIIYKLDEIISNNLGYFSNLEESAKDEIRNTFGKVKAEINKHIQFLDLKRYVDSPNMQYLKSKATQGKVDADFCLNLGNILDYWNENKRDYREQDRILTNIYEDLSGAVRVYIKIKPLIGVEQKSKTVSIQTIENKKQKSVVLDCTGVEGAANKTKDVFGEFYGIFGETFRNIDVYSGIENTPSDQQNPLNVNVNELVESSESINPGLWSTFKQVEDGYSIVLFGYGASGAGKTMTLLGNRGTPGLIHYGLANLEGVQQIKLKYLFEQYVSAFDITLKKIRGKIHNLINKVPALSDLKNEINEGFVVKDETDMFGRRIPSTINVNDLKVNDLFTLTDIIDRYRMEMGRIKKTPNNPTSSRSHLFFVFQITFKNGKKGYVTLVDTAGRELPVEIFKTFIDTSRTSLESIMSGSGQKIIEKYVRRGLDSTYTPNYIFEVLKEGFYINETINHLTYFFNKKNYKETDVQKQGENGAEYSVGRYYVLPQSEEEEINENKNCLMIPILKFLDKISSSGEGNRQFKPTKFIMMCMVRQEERYCDQIHETLEFAARVKSS